jgi:hypothetical protein
VVQPVTVAPLAMVAEVLAAKPEAEARAAVAEPAAQTSAKA